jgi:hypothetical protein
MKSKNSQDGNEKGKHEHALPNEISDEQRKINTAAHEQAEKDIDNDPEFSAHSPNDDLDEGELARLGEDNTDPL